jgi:hypothetical protein
MALRARRGQAFETMMLVISVIVAIAILTILLGFLGGISFGATDAKSVINDLLKAVERKSVGIEQKNTALFDKGVIISAAEIISGTAIQRGDVRFQCSEDAFCTDSDAPITIIEGGGGTTARLTVKSKVNGAIVACKGEASEYYVCVGRPEKLGKGDDLDPSKVCSDKCVI